MNRLKYNFGKMIVQLLMLFQKYIFDDQIPDTPKILFSTLLKTDICNLLLKKINL